jgi:hypothetical protein
MPFCNLAVQADIAPKSTNAMLGNSIIDAVKKKKSQGVEITVSVPPEMFRDIDRLLIYANKKPLTILNGFME